MTRPVAIIVVCTILVVAALLGAGAVAIVKIHDEAERTAQQAYNQDVRSWKEKLQGCSRAKLQARLSRQGWEVAARARAAQSGDPDISTNPSNAYELIVSGYKPLVDDLDCLVAYPPPLVPDGVTPDPSIERTMQLTRAQDRKGAALEGKIRALSIGKP